MKKLLIVLIAAVVPIVVIAQNSWTKQPRYYSKCYWATAPFGGPITADKLRDCVHDLIDGLNEQEENLDKLGSNIGHESTMQGYSRSRIMNLESDVEELKRSVQNLQFEIDALRARLPKSK